MGLKREITSPQRQMHMLAFQKSGLGTPALAGEGKFDGTIADNGVGDYTITFDEAFVRIPLCIAVSKTSAKHIRCVPALGSVQVLCFDMDGTTPAEADFDLICLGSMVADQL
jgi:hypothetical protein